MLERGELSQVTANAELADRLMATARQHLASVRLLADSDPYLAYVAVYDAIRKALSALLQIQGLRATTSGGHLAIMHAVQAQFGASMGAILRPVDRIRVTRHEAEYPGQATYIDQDTVLDDLPKAEAVVEAVEKALPHLSPFTRPKLRPVWWAIRGLTWCSAVRAWWCSDYFRLSGIGAPMSVKASRWTLVGSASIGTVARVPVNRTWLRVKVARWSSRPRKL
jgi:uncharacterized protein (UPF0332 family)